MNPFTGTYTAIITPFKDGAVDYGAVEGIVQRQIEGGVDGIVPCGTTGESPTLTPREHDEVIERVVKMVEGHRKGAAARSGTACRATTSENKDAAAGVVRVRVLAGTGSNSTAETLRMSRHAAEAGADGLLLVSPYYNRPTQEGLFQHFSAIATDVKLPIMLYNIPGRTGVEITIETIRRLHAAHDNITSVKHATGKVDDAAELMSCCGIAVLSGDDPITWPLMALGAVGVVSVLSNLAPRTVKRLTDAGLAGDMAAGREAHAAVFGLGRAPLSLATNPIPIKTAMAMRGFCREEFRLPLCGMGDDARGKLELLLRGNRLD